MAPSKEEPAVVPKTSTSSCCPPADEEPAAKTPAVKCDGCGEIFPSRNAVFKHLKEIDGACLSKEDFKNFVRYVRKAIKPPKVILLYGYLPYGCGNSSKSKSTPEASATDGNDDDDDNSRRRTTTIRNGQDAGNILMQTIQQLQNEIDGIEDDDDDDNEDNSSSSSSSLYKVNRSYGYFSRSAECVQQDMDTGAVTEVMAARLYPLRGDISLDDWLDRVQAKLDTKFNEEKQTMGDDDDDKDCCRVTPIRIIGRQDMPNAKFNAEMDVSVTN